jgi:hypothetical protein
MQQAKERFETESQEQHTYGKPYLVPGKRGWSVNSSAIMAPIAHISISLHGSPYISQQYVRQAQNK